jgi:hypothetical protein
MISQKELKKYVDYDPDTGIFKWKHRINSEFSAEHYWRTWNRNNAGKTINGTPSKKRLYFKVKGVFYPASNLVSIYMTDKNPLTVAYKDEKPRNNQYNNLIFNYQKKGSNKSTRFSYAPNLNRWEEYKDGLLVRFGKLHDMIPHRIA